MDRVPSVKEFLDATSRHALALRQDRPPRLATVDAAHISGLPRVTFDGEASLTTKTFPYADGYTPTAADRVLLIPTGKRSYVIIGKIIN